MPILTMSPYVYVPGYTQEFLDALLVDLISWWKLDEESGNAVDVHGANDLSHINDPGSVSGKVGNARQCVAANSEGFTHTSNSDFGNGDNDFTFMGWCNFASKPALNNLVSKRDTSTGGTEDYWLMYRGDFDRFEWSVFAASTSNFVRAEAFGSPPTNEWMFVVAEHNSVTNLITIQINNGTINSTSYSDGSGNKGYPFYLGGEGAGFQCNGTLDEWGYYKRILTTAEKNYLYNNGQGRTYEDFA